ncbi:hypothetical protein NEIMUCOT_04437 [Neisseria mucosa ATCC 25996]|uniref:Uncharacterized protein n=1 Tax=Neisseria mucosa (strain ATCC 25996 / DSM 4631 / NCTC 10774 / M26) TaxID=546266 RepID=D2ZUZ6_NEIM2|nr:hypothetical protein NEIMUCOT_04437 [Neisseria mucosa ATCC 25996]
MKWETGDFSRFSLIKTDKRSSENLPSLSHFIETAFSDDLRLL